MLNKTVEAMKEKQGIWLTRENLKMLLVALGSTLKPSMETSIICLGSTCGHISHSFLDPKDLFSWFQGSVFLIPRILFCYSGVWPSWAFLSPHSVCLLHFSHATPLFWFEACFPQSGSKTTIGWQDHWGLIVPPAKPEFKLGSKFFLHCMERLTDFFFQLKVGFELYLSKPNHSFSITNCLLCGLLLDIWLSQLVMNTH